MNKTFLLNSDLRSPKFLGAPASVRGYWIALQAFCSERESGGVIKAARTFSSGEWGTIMGAGGGIRARDRLLQFGLARWSGDDLIVSLYHLDSERGYQDKRIRASAGGRARAAKEHERRDQLEASDLGRVESSGRLSPTIASASGSERRGSDSRGEASEARRGREEAGIAEHGPSGLPLDDSPESPRDPDEAVKLFQALHYELLGASYRPTQTDTIAIRSNWTEFEPNGLPERMRAYLASGSDEVPSITGFLGWQR